MARPKETTGKPTTRRRPSENRRLLLEAAERVSAREGRSISFGAIAQEAGVSRSAMYRHFPSRDALLTEAALAPFVDFLEAFRSVALGQIRAGSPIWDMERAFVSAIVDHFANHQEYVATVLSERSVLDDKVKAELFLQIEQVIDEITEVAIELGGATGVPSNHVPIWTRFVIALAVGWVTNESWLMSPAMSRDELLDSLTTFVLYGIQRPPHREDG